MFDFVVFFTSEPEHYERPTSAHVPATPELMAGCSQAVAFATETASGVFAAELGPGIAADEADIKATSRGLERARRLTVHRIGVGGARLALKNGLDHLAAVAADLRREPFPVWSSTTLVRAALEAEATFSYLLVPRSAVHLRLARTAGLELTDAEHRIKLAKDLGPEFEAGARKRREKLVKLYRQAGIEMVTGRKSSAIAGMRVEGEQAPTDISFTDEVRKFWPAELPVPYRVLSGAAHSRNWVLGSWDEFAATGATALHVMQVSGQIVETWLALWEEYTGVSTSGEREQVRRNCATVSAAFIYRASP